jgi:hypothetical protein
MSARFPTLSVLCAFVLKNPVRASAALLTVLAAPCGAAWRVADLAPMTRAGEAVAPVVSPDGRRVGYLVGSRFTVPDAPDVLSGRLWVMDRAAGQASRVGKVNVDALQGEAPAAFSPQDAAYAYVEGLRADPNLWYVDASGGRFRVANGRAMSFSPDGKYLAYVRWQGGDATTSAVELWLFDTRSRESKRLARVDQKEPPTRALTPRWVAEASRIVFAAGGSLYSYARYTGELADIVGLTDVRDFDAHPDGVLWFQRRAGTADTDGIWSADTAGARPLRLFAGSDLPADISELTAAPDPNAILFIAATDAGHSLIIADARDGHWRSIARADSFSRQPGGDLVALEVPDPRNKDKRNIYTGRLSRK